MGGTFDNDEVLGSYSDLSNSGAEVAITACYIGRHTISKEGVTADRSVSVGKSSKASSNVPEAVLSGDTIRVESEERASTGSEDSAGEARRRDSVEQHGSVVQLVNSKACNRCLSATAVWTGVQYIGSSTTITKSQERASARSVELCSEHVREDNARLVPMRFNSSSVGVATAHGGA